MSFGSVLKQLRERSGITQLQLSKLIQVSRSAIGMYESDLREPDFETLEKIADHFNVTMDFLCGKDSRSGSTHYPAAPINETPCNIIRIAGRDGSFTEHKLSDEQIELIRRMIEQMPNFED